MTDKEPTQEQIEELWKWCGLFQFNRYDQVSMWLDSTNTIVSSITNGLPTFDLNNLFKYAVPKLISEGFNISLYYLIGDHRENSTEGKWTCSVGNDNCNFATYKSDIDPALALFWAIWKVVKNDDKT